MVTSVRPRVLLVSALHGVRPGVLRFEIVAIGDLICFGGRACLYLVGHWWR